MVQFVHTLISLKSLISLFSPFAGEGFTCLDHSMLSKKKYTALRQILHLCRDHHWSQKKEKGVVCGCHKSVLQVKEHLATKVQMAFEIMVEVTLL